MEPELQNYLDNIMNDISPQLFLMSMVFGSVFIIIGLVLLFKRSEYKYVKHIGLICLGFGILTIVSSFFGI